ncbi:sensor histidine kinase [Phenylobacterium soli]|uniref:histidine kinase n=1 Tax=Phenylobacterium soli TaxID=2170551 RepID=A0A328AMD5_9CAUL|nr:HWE histidine kinase domain-containing protein [Phenylobacterium soli]RAK56122.1 hypothetical protein DJ017_17185 [Phenylobacterium soli]
MFFRAWITAEQDKVLAAQIGRAIVQSSHIQGLFACRRDGRVIFCNEAAADYLARPRGQVIRRPIQDVLAELPDRRSARMLAAALDQGREREFVMPRPGAAGCFLRVRVLPVGRGSLAFFLRDATQEAQATLGLRRKEHRLRLANESLRLAHRAARAASWEWRAGEALRWLDLAAARALIGLPRQWTEHEKLRDWINFVDPEDIDTVNAGLARLATEDESVYEFRVIGADGRRHWVESHATASDRDASGVPRRLTGVTSDITSRKAAEAALRHETAELNQAKTHLQLVVGELNHRVKNMLAVVQSLARQSFGNARSAELENFEDRLMALAWTHDILVDQRWAGATLDRLIDGTLAPHRRKGADRITADGPHVVLDPKLAIAFSLALHELATNAVKYGALRGAHGTVSIHWEVEDRHGEEWLVLEWRERGGPPVSPPKRRGFGSRLIERGVTGEIGGKAHLDFDPAGLSCCISAPLYAPDPEREPLSHESVRRKIEGLARPTEEPRPNI